MAMPDRATTGATAWEQEPHYCQRCERARVVIDGKWYACYLNHEPVPVRAQYSCLEWERRHVETK